MSESTEDTQSGPVREKPPEDIQPGRPAEPEKTSRRGTWLKLLIGGWLLLFLIALMSGYTGYRSGTDARAGTQTAEAFGEIEHQYQIGLEELAGMECDRARQRFEWVIEQDPNHTGAIDALARAITCLNATATPTPVTPTATPTLTPTPDLRTGDEKFDQARAAMSAGDWELAIDTLFSLRKEDPEFMAVEVDSMLYVAFRNRGVNRILNLGELEGGLYDLSQAELFGPLDSEAEGYRNWARLYLIGASFYSVQDWAQASFYLGQVAPFAPNLRNGSSGLAMVWYLDALDQYITLLDESKDWCTAAAQLEIYMLYADDADEQNSRLNTYRNRCEEDENG